jgi:hypothetical protein
MLIKPYPVPGTSLRQKGRPTNDQRKLICYFDCQRYNRDKASQSEVSPFEKGDE